MTRIEEEDIDKTWDEVKEKYPNVSQEEFELQQKQFQEM
jgi:ribosomal protein S17E